jgi:hypothetical protein
LLGRKDPHGCRKRLRHQQRNACGDYRGEERQAEDEFFVLGENDRDV